MQRSPPADRHGAPDKESLRRPWVIRDDPSTVTTESKVMNLSELKCRSARKRSLLHDALVVTNLEPARRSKPHPRPAEMRRLQASARCLIS